MPAPLFYLFAMVTLVFGVMVVALRNPVASALSLVVCFTGLAALFISLDAFFIGTIQILVYAGAVMVLFLFIIMLLDIKAESERKPNLLAVAGGVFLAVMLVMQVLSVTSTFQLGKQTMTDKPLDLAKAVQTDTLKTIKHDLVPTDGRPATLPDTKLMGFTLFDKYPFHLQIVGLLLLLGTVGVVVLSRRDKEDTAP